MAVILAVAGDGAILAEHAANPLLSGRASTRPSATWRARRSASGPRAAACGPPITTGTSTGAVNAMHDSLTPLGGLVPLFLILLGEITPGGVGAGLYGMLVFALLTVFIAGLMVGRTPEYLGKKVESFEMKMSMLVVLVLSASILGFTALATATDVGRAGPLNAGPHGFSEILYAFASQTGNNGSAFARPDRQHDLLQRRPAPSRCWSGASR